MSSPPPNATPEQLRRLAEFNKRFYGPRGVGPTDGGYGGPLPKGPQSTLNLPVSRPNVDPAFLAKAVASGALPPPRPSTPGTMPPTRPPVTPLPSPGFSTRPGGLGGVPANRPSLSPAEEAFMRNARSGMSSVNTTTQANIMGTARPSSGGFNPGNMMQGLQSIAARNNPQASSPAAPAFKKGGKVAAKAAPVKKAAGGKVAAKAPVKKAMGGKVAAKPMARPVAKAKPMSAMKRGGKVMAKGRYK